MSQADLQPVFISPNVDLHELRKEVLEGYTTSSSTVLDLIDFAINRLSSDTEQMAYVAADPNQPGTAWAATVDEPAYAKDIAESLSEWVLKGAHVMRVNAATARQMLMKWERPEDVSRLQTSLL